MSAFEYHAETFVNIRDEIFFVSHCNGTILSLNDNKHYVYYRQGKIKGSDCKSEPLQAIHLAATFRDIALPNVEIYDQNALSNQVMRILSSPQLTFW